MDKKDKISILIVSDIHESIENLNKLRENCEKHSYKPDYIFILGDLVSVPVGDQDKKEIGETYYNLINEILKLLENISPKVIYIPGNRDPKILFENEDNKVKFGSSSINIHKKKYDITDNLFVVGIGGSVTNVSSNEKEYHKYNVSFNDVDWKGFPYIDNFEKPNFEKSEMLYQKDLDIIFNFIKENKNKKVIILCHNGPFKSSSSNCFENNGCYYGGSLILDNYINENKNNILSVLHGHTHLGTGICTLYDINVLNPGSLKLGFYGKMDLVERNGNWIVKNISKFRI
jgi:Icc-related predicted phosphoesterase